MRKIEKFCKKLQKSEKKREKERKRETVFNRGERGDRGEELATKTQRHGEKLATNEHESTQDCFGHRDHRDHRDHRGFLFQQQSTIALNPKLGALLASKLAVGASLWIFGYALC